MSALLEWFKHPFGIAKPVICARCNGTMRQTRSKYVAHGCYVTEYWCPDCEKTRTEWS